MFFTVILDLFEDPRKKTLQTIRFFYLGYSCNEIK